MASYGEAAESGEVVVNATPGSASFDDIANPLDFSAGFPPSLTVANTDSLAEGIQRAHPDARVVKALNTVTAAVMVNPGALGDGDHTLFLCGDDPAARDTVAGWLREWFGWRHILDLGALSAARGTAAYLLLWVRAMSAQDTAMFNVKVVR